MAALPGWEVAVRDLNRAFEAAIAHVPPLDARGAEAAAIGLLRARAGAPAGATVGDDEVALAIEIANVLGRQLRWPPADATNAALRAAAVFQQQLQLLQPGAAPAAYTAETTRRARDAAILSISRFQTAGGQLTPRPLSKVTFFRNFSQMVIDGDNKRALVDLDAKITRRPPTAFGMDEEEDDGEVVPLAPQDPSEQKLDALSVNEAWSEFARGRFEVNQVLERARIDALTKIRLYVISRLKPKSKVHARLSSRDLEEWFTALMRDDMKTVQSILYDLAHVHYNRSKSSAPDAETSITNLRHTNTIELAAIQMLGTKAVIDLIVHALYLR